MRLSRAAAGKDPVVKAKRQKQTRHRLGSTGYFVVNADRTAAGVIGMWRNLTPVVA